MLLDALHVYGPKEKADKTELEKLINEAKSLNSEDYTKDSFELLENALESARIVYNNEQATQEEVEKATKSLQSAIDGLKKADEGGTDSKPDVPGNPDGDNDPDHTLDKSEGGNDADWEPDASDGKNTEDSSPQTGDTTSLISSTVVVSAFMGIICIVILRKKRMK